MPPKEIGAGIYFTHIQETSAKVLKLWTLSLIFLKCANVLICGATLLANMQYDKLTLKKTSFCQTQCEWGRVQTGTPKKKPTHIYCKCLDCESVLRIIRTPRLTSLLLKLFRQAGEQTVQRNDGAKQRGEVFKCDRVALPSNRWEAPRSSFKVMSDVLLLNILIKASAFPTPKHTDRHTDTQTHRHTHIHTHRYILPCQ